VISVHVHLVLVGDQVTVVDPEEHAIGVLVILARVAHAIGVHVELVVYAHRAVAVDGTVVVGGLNTVVIAVITQVEAVGGCLTAAGAIEGARAVDATRESEGKVGVKEADVETRWSPASGLAWVHEIRAAVTICVRVAGVSQPVAVEVALIASDHRRWVVRRDAVVLDIGDRVAIEIGVADVTDSVSVDVLLRLIELGGRVGGERTVVLAISHRVSVHVVITRVAQTVTVKIRLVGVGHQGAVVGQTLDEVSVGIGIADITEPVTVDVELVRVGVQRAVVDAVLQGVVCAHDGARRIEVRRREAVVDVVLIAVGVAGVALSITVEIQLRHVGAAGTVVTGIANPVAVSVRIGVGAVGERRAEVLAVGSAVSVHVARACVAYAVVVRVLLIGIGDKRAEITLIAHRVTIGVELGGVGVHWAVVIAPGGLAQGAGLIGVLDGVLEDPIAIDVLIAQVSLLIGVLVPLEIVEVVLAVVARVADPVAVDVDLLGIVGLRADVHAVRHEVLVVVTVDVIGLPIAIEIRVARLAHAIEIEVALHHVG